MSQGNEVKVKNGVIRKKSKTEESAKILSGMLEQKDSESAINCFLRTDERIATNIFIGTKKGGLERVVEEMKAKMLFSALCAEVGKLDRHNPHKSQAIHKLQIIAGNALLKSESPHISKRFLNKLQSSLEVAVGMRNNGKSAAA